jgi:hypothetical protein
MSKILIYIGENEYFDADVTIDTITDMPGISDPRRGQFIGSVFQCKYTFEGRVTTVRLTDKLKTVTVEGLEIESLEFAVQFQKLMPMPLHAIDMEYSFDVILSRFDSGEEFLSKIKD